MRRGVLHPMPLCYSTARIYPATGPTVPPGYTLAIKKIDERTFELIQKMNSKALYTSTFTASADGKTLTETDSANTEGQKVTAIYDRQ